MCHKIIRQLSIMQNQWEFWACFLEIRLLPLVGEGRQWHSLIGFGHKLQLVYYGLSEVKLRQEIKVGKLAEKGPWPSVLGIQDTCMGHRVQNNSAALDEDQSESIIYNSPFTSDVKPSRLLTRQLGSNVRSSDFFIGQWSQMHCLHERVAI